MLHGAHKAALPAKIQKGEPQPHLRPGLKRDPSCDLTARQPTGAGYTNVTNFAHARTLPQDPHALKSQREMAAPAIAVERFRVEHGDGFTMPVVSLTDRRAAGNRLVRFVFQRHLETGCMAAPRARVARSGKL